VRVPATVDALAGTVSGDLDSPSIRATELIYVASMLEQAKMFEAVDRLVQLFESGRLPIGEGWRRERSARMRRPRRSACRSVSAAPSIDGCWEWTPTATTRRIATFNDLWLRFLSAVASFARAGRAPLTRLP